MIKVKEIHLAPNLKDSMVVSLQKMSDGLAAEDLAKDAKICSDIGTFLLAVKKTALDVDFDEKFHLMRERRSILTVARAVVSMERQYLTHGNNLVGHQQN